jgi:lipopolysaccharide transport system ATP-binding protein
MVVRLAFAVQVVVPKDILIVDEALAVGDMFFQAKCMARMRRMLDDGVTVLFVSHDIGAIKSLCQRALFLNYGAMEDEGDVARVVDRYFAARVRGEQAVIDSELPTITDTAPIEHAAFTPSEEFLRRSAFERIQNGRARFANVQIINTHGRPIDVADYDQPITLRMAIEITDDINDDLTFGYHITDSNGINIIYTDSAIEQLQIERPRRGERYIIDSTFRASLRHGTYSVIAAISIPINLAQAQVDYCDYIPIATQFTVSPRPGSIIYGLVRLDNQTQITRVGQP